MFCRHCGKDIPDDSKFCHHCGGATALPGAPETAAAGEPDTGELLLALRPVFIPWEIVLTTLPIGLFMTVWGGGFFGGFGTLAIRGLGLPIPMWTPFVFFGLLIGGGIPLLAYLSKKKTYAKTEYRFYRDRLEYSEGFWTVENKTVRYDKITETAMRRGIIQKRYGLGTIYLSTPASGFASHGQARSGIKIVDVENPEAVYEAVQKLTR